MTYYQSPRQGLRPLTGDQRAAAWRDYQAACKQAYIRGSLSSTAHILWFFGGLFTFGLGWIGWIIHMIFAPKVLRPGMYAPPWPPPGYYIP